MGKQLDLEEMIAQTEAAKKEYNEVLASGMMGEWFPQLTQDWNRDELKWASIYEDLLKARDYKYGTKR